MRTEQEEVRILNRAIRLHDLTNNLRSTPVRDAEVQKIEDELKKESILDNSGFLKSENKDALYIAISVIFEECELDDLFNAELISSVLIEQARVLLDKSDKNEILGTF